jgi:hypothetical protein
MILLVMEYNGIRSYKHRVRNDNTNIVRNDNTNIVRNDNTNIESETITQT